MLAVVLATLTKLVAILKLGLRNILNSTTACFDSYNFLSFKMIDKANSKFDLKIREALHINWTKPNLNAQQNHLAPTLSLELVPPLLFYLFFPFLFHLLFSLYLTLIIGIFYSLNYTSLLLHLNAAQLVNTFYNNYVLNICPRQLLKFKINHVSMNDYNYGKFLKVVSLQIY